MSRTRAQTVMFHSGYQLEEFADGWIPEDEAGFYDEMQSQQVSVQDIDDEHERHVFSDGSVIIRKANTPNGPAYEHYL